MTQSTLLQQKSDMPQRPLANCHGGQGSIDWTGILGYDELQGRRLQFLHDDILPPGTSIGIHPHMDMEEYYYILEGKGLMTLDGVDHPIQAGDIACVFPGGSHGLSNNGSSPLRLIVIGIS